MIVLHLQLHGGQSLYARNLPLKLLERPVLCIYSVVALQCVAHQTLLVHVAHRLCKLRFLLRAPPLRLEYERNLLLVGLLDARVLVIRRLCTLLVDKEVVVRHSLLQNVTVLFGVGRSSVEQRMRVSRRDDPTATTPTETTATTATVSTTIATATVSISTTTTSTSTTTTITSTINGLSCATCDCGASCCNRQVESQFALQFGVPSLRFFNLCELRFQ